MAAPHIHAISSAKRFGGKMEDYIEIHAKMDCSKAYVPDNRHRVLTHTMFWIVEVMIPIYGHTMENSDGKIVSVKDVCEQHILEDFRHKFIPTPQDYIQYMNPKEWMMNGKGKELPTSCEQVYRPTEGDGVIDEVKTEEEKELPIKKLKLPKGPMVLDGRLHRGGRGMESMTLD